MIKYRSGTSLISILATLLFAGCSGKHADSSAWDSGGGTADEPSSDQCEPKDGETCSAPRESGLVRITTTGDFSYFDEYLNETRHCAESSASCRISLAVELFNELGNRIEVIPDYYYPVDTYDDYLRDGQHNVDYDHNSEWNTLGMAVLTTSVDQNTGFFGADGVFPVDMGPSEYVVDAKVYAVDVAYSTSSFKLDQSGTTEVSNNEDVGYQCLCLKDAVSIDGINSSDSG